MANEKKEESGLDRIEELANKGPDGPEIDPGVWPPLKTDEELASSPAPKPTEFPNPPPTQIGVPAAETHPRSPLRGTRAQAVLTEEAEYLGLRGHLRLHAPRYEGGPYQVELLEPENVSTAGIPSDATEDEFRTAIQDLVASREKVKNNRRELAGRQLQSAAHEVIPYAQDPSHPPVGGVQQPGEPDRTGNPAPLDRAGRPLKGRVLPERPLGLWAKHRRRCSARSPSTLDW